MDNYSGRIVKSYQITGQINVGGFGTIYRAYQSVIEREVALKVISPRYANEAEFIRLFEVEARTIARLEHPFIVPLYDFWREPDGAFLVMRLMRGGSLRDIASDGALPLEQVLHYLDQIAGALDMAHRNKIIHRDIKPENILLDEDNNAYLTDFGIAQRHDVDSGDLDSMAGSVNYIPPEMIRGLRPSPASDVYSLGIMVFELLAGQLPFQSESAPPMLMHHLNTNFPNIRQFAPHLPDTVDQVLQRACSKEAEDRYVSVLDFVKALQQVTGELSDDMRRVTSETYQVLDNPYKGLRPFGEADAQDFFGREQLVVQLMDRLNEDRAAANFLAIVGPSGSGKSSVVRAGLIPQMRLGEVADTFNWFIADFVPSVDPIANLANALLSLSANPIPDLLERLQSDESAIVWAAEQILSRASDGRLLLFIDQFEEVFTLTDDDRIRTHLLNMLTYAVHQSPDIFIVVTIRADFFDKPLLYDGISDLIQARTQVVLPLSIPEIERAITGPADNIGLIVDHDLVAAIVADVREEPGALPLLQYTLTELFERRETNRMTLDSYIDSGGVLSSLARRAQEVYDDLLVTERDVLRQIFLRLVTLGEGTEDTRRRVKRSELLTMGQDRSLVESVLATFGKYRLLTFDRDPATREPTVEIAHEALIKRWDDLQNWLDESRHDVRLQRSLANAANEWHEHGERPGYLLYGARLLQYEEWLTETSVAVTALESAFIDASIREKKRQEDDEAQRKQREIALQERVLNRTRLLAAIMGIAVLITIGLSFVAINQRQSAQIERDNAQIARATSDANAQNAQARAAEIQNFNLVNIAQQALQEGDSGLAVTLLQTIADNENLSVQVQSSMMDVAYSTQLRQQLAAHSRKVTALAISPDGSVIATGSEDLSVLLWDANSNEILGQLVGHRGAISDLAFSPDGRQLVSVGNDALVIVWDVDSRQSMQQLNGHRNVITGVDFAPDGQSIVTSSSDDTLIIWDINSGEIVLQLVGHSDSVRAVAYSPDGQQIVSGSRDGTLILWDATSGEQLRIFSGHNDSVEALDFAPNGTRIVSGSFDRRIIVWDVETATIVTTLIGHSDEVSSLAISPDSRLLVSTSCAERDTDRACLRGEVILWNLLNGQVITNFLGHREMVNAAIFTPDGSRVITGSCANRQESACTLGEALIWDALQTSEAFSQLRGHESSVFSVALNQDQSLLLSGGGSVLLEDQPQGDTSIILWETATGDMLQRFEGHSGNVTELLFHPNNTEFVSASRDSTILVWSLESNSIMRSFEGHSSSIYDIEFNSDATRVLSAGDNQVLYWDYQSLEVMLTLENFGSQLSARALAISPDDSILAIGLNNGIIILWDAVADTELRRLLGHTDDVLTLEFSADGTTLLSGSNDRSVRSWDVASGAETSVHRGHLAPVTDVSLVEGGRYVLSASEDNTLHYWEFESGEIIRMFDLHSAAIYDVTLAQDGSIAYSASADGTLIGWRVSLDALINWLGENRFSRDLTDEERAGFQLEG